MNLLSFKKCLEEYFKVAHDVSVEEWTIEMSDILDNFTIMHNKIPLATVFDNVVTILYVAEDLTLLTDILLLRKYATRVKKTQTEFYFILVDKMQQTYSLQKNSTCNMYAEQVYLQHKIGMSRKEFVKRFAMLHSTKDIDTERLYKKIPYTKYYKEVVT